MYGILQKCILDDLKSRQVAPVPVQTPESTCYVTRANPSSHLGVVVCRGLVTVGLDDRKTYCESFWPTKSLAHRNQPGCQRTCRHDRSVQDVEENEGEGPPRPWADPQWWSRGVLPVTPCRTTHAIVIFQVAGVGSIALSSMNSVCSRRRLVGRPRTNESTMSGMNAVRSSSALAVTIG